MLAAENRAPPFYPPHVKPAAKPLGFPSFFIKLIKNNLELIPERAYHEPLVYSSGPPRIAFFTGAELVKTLLLSRQGEFPKGALQVRILKPVFGNAMHAAEAREWRWQRGAAAPLFRHEELLRYGPIVSTAAEAIVAKWRAAPTGAVHEINKDIMRAAFDVICKTMLGGGAEDMLHEIEKGHADYYRGMNWWIMYTLLGLPHWVPRPGGKSMRAHERRLRQAVAGLVRARREADTDGDDLLARLLRASDAESGRKMPDELLVDNIVSFVMSGYETTALSLSWTLYLISQSPEWESRMLDEIEEVASSGPITSQHVQHLIIVQQVLNESLRLYPTAPLIVRDIVHDVEFDGIPIPAGTLGIIPIYAIHRHRAYWKDADRFDPSRFATASKPDRFCFMPFGAGPRICIGATLAMMEATIMLGTFVRAAHFDSLPDFNAEPSGRMFLVPKNGMPMRVTLRSDAKQSR